MYDWMNELTDWLNERTNEWTNKRMNEQMNECTWNVLTGGSQFQISDILIF